MEMTEDQRIAVIAKAVENSRLIVPSQSVEEFIAEIKTQDVISRHGLLDAQKDDLEDEISLTKHAPCAESIDEEDESLGVSDEMKGVYQ
jgi:predicted transcriptional regulator